MADVTFTLETEEAKAVQGFLKLVDAQKKAETGASRIKQSHRSMERESSSAFSKMGRDVLTFAAGFATVESALSAVRGVFRNIQQDIKDSAQEARTFQQQFIDLQFLGEHWKEPGFRAEALKGATAAGIMPGEFVTGQYMFESATAGMPKELQEALYNRLLEQKRTTALPMNMLSQLYGTAGLLAERQTGEKPEAFAMRVQNLIMKTIEEAKATPEAMASQFPRALAAGKMGGLSLEETGALFAYATQLTGTTERAAGAVDIMIREMMTPGEKIKTRGGGGGGGGLFSKGGGGGESLGAVWKRAGITEEDSAIKRIRKLAPLYQKGELTDVHLRKLVGAEALPVAKEMFTAPERLEGFLGRMEEAGATPESLIQQKRQEVMATDEIYKLTQEMNELESGIAGMKAQRVDSLRIQKGALEIEQKYEQAALEGVPAAVRIPMKQIEEKQYATATALGVSPETAQDISQAPWLNPIMLAGQLLLKAARKLDKATAGTAAAARNTGVE